MGTLVLESTVRSFRPLSCTPKLSWDVPGDTDHLCDKAAVLGAAIQERHSNFLCTAVRRIVQEIQILDSLTLWRLTTYIYVVLHS